MGLPARMSSTLSGRSQLQMTVLQPAAVAMRAAVSLVDMPPVPHCEPGVHVSTCEAQPLQCLRGEAVLPRDFQGEPNAGGLVEVAKSTNPIGGLAFCSAFASGISCISHFAHRHRKLKPQTRFCLTTGTSSY